MVWRLMMERLGQLAQRTDCVFDSRPPSGPNPVVSLGGIFHGVWQEIENCRIGQLFYGRRALERRFPGLDGQIQGVAAGLCLLFQNSDFFRWPQLEYRELESFLRTENHRPVFQGLPKLEESAQKMLAELKENLLLAHFLDCWGRVLGGIGKASIRWEKRPLSNMQSALELQGLVFYPFCQRFGLSWVLFSLEGEDFIFKGGQMEEWEKSALRRFIGHVFQKEGLNIIAEV